jgi:hypothetical protein
MPDSCSEKSVVIVRWLCQPFVYNFFVIGVRLVVIVFWVWVPAAADKATMWLNFHGISNNV